MSLFPLHDTSDNLVLLGVTVHPKPDMDLTCLDNCIDENNPKSFDDMTAGQFLEERLKEIGLKK